MWMPTKVVKAGAKYGDEVFVEFRKGTPRWCKAAQLTRHVPADTMAQTEKSDEGVTKPDMDTDTPQAQAAQLTTVPAAASVGPVLIHATLSCSCM